MKKILVAVLLLSSAHLAFCGGSVGKKDKKALSEKGKAQSLFLLGMQDKLKHMSEEQRKRNIESFKKLLETVADLKSNDHNTRVPAFNLATKT